ncbi:Hydroxyethylthiazole kinase [Cantharellus anzutake]|uniref:Hydroxyethylthiazole kinase n=1 Tax=Cantharellus anzutake TaxID=1750568 RepID=UPI0019085439|nr:Hydroxyethylthiazole kinase [Cantharellus anzutake]KAF8335747.1 Hydroxyethylthiazole kinase [Cantharellus anzutake]
MSQKRDIDYSLYLVTGRELLPKGIDYYDSLEESLKGGVTAVQVREKTVDTGETQEICSKYNVPIIINDRIDVALAIKADGVHLGQTDMPIEIAKKLLPPSMVLGLSVSSPAEATLASKAGVDYVGIGPIWWTTSKKLTKDVIGPRGISSILDALSQSIKTIGIGGIKYRNLIRTLHGAVTASGRTLDGIAVISEIVSSSEPRKAAENLRSLHRAFTDQPHPTQPFTPWTIPTELPTRADIVHQVAKLIVETRALTPLVHQITNYVAMTQSANITLAMGASPIMATAPTEMEDLSKVCGGLLINFGTIGDFEGMLLAGEFANLNKKPVVFDPVAVGATAHRRSTANQLLNAWQATVIKGNASEIGALAGLTEVKSRGVDSIGDGFTDPATVVKELSLKERCIVVMTGKDDWISNGESVIKLSNGHHLLPGITASGCIVGSAIATYCGTVNILARRGLAESSASDGRLVLGDMLLGAVAGVLAITIASEIAGERPDVRLGHLTPEPIIRRAKITQIA